MTGTLLGALLGASVANAAGEERMVWSLSLGGQVVGERTAVFRDVADGVRTAEVVTRVDTTGGPVGFRWESRLVGSAQNEPMGFHAEIRQDGRGREVSGRRVSDGWLVATGPWRKAKEQLLALDAVHLSTVDLIDPGAERWLGAFSSVRVLSAETGDVFEGTVQRIGTRTLDVAGRAVAVEGYVWTSPEGRLEFWYDADGHLVLGSTMVFGFRIEARLTSAVPAGPDTFPVRLPKPSVNVEPL